jgi:hypothetical protein
VSGASGWLGLEAPGVHVAISATTAIAPQTMQGTLLDVGMDDTWSAFYETKFDPLLGLDFSNVLGDALCTER